MSHLCLIFVSNALIAVILDKLMGLDKAGIHSLTLSMYNIFEFAQVADALEDFAILKASKTRESDR